MAGAPQPQGALIRPAPVFPQMPANADRETKAWMSAMQASVATWAHDVERGFRGLEARVNALESKTNK